MPRNTPYLQRRGDTFSFRIAVPADLQQYLLRRELTKALDTGDKVIAVPRSLLLAAKAKRLFHHLRQMTKENKKRPEDGIRLDYSFGLSFDELNKPTVTAQAEPHETEALGLRSEARHHL